MRTTPWLPSGARQWAHTLASGAAAPLSFFVGMLAMMVVDGKGLMGDE